MKIRQVEAELFHAYGQTDRETDMTEPVVAFRNFAKASINGAPTLTPRKLSVHSQFMPSAHECSP